MAYTALTAQSVAARAAMIIQDLTNVRWPITELRDWLNDARRELAVVRPDIYATTIEEHSLSPAGAKHELPDGALRLLDIPRNSATGKAVTVTQRGFLDQQNPGWAASSFQSDTIKHFMVDERDKTHFWVYPPSNGSAKVCLIYQAAPEDFALAAGNTEIAGSLNDFETLYAGAMVDYICYRAFSKDSEYAGNTQRALAHYQQFQNALGIGHRNDLTYSPNLTNVGGVPSKQLATGG